jgi:hypothetical protein
MCRSQNRDDSIDHVADKPQIDTGQSIEVERCSVSPEPEFQTLLTGI